MTVYLIRAGENGPVKIGHATSVPRRLSTLQTSHYERLALLRTWAGGKPEEASLHRAFSEYRLTGEWFHFCQSMMDADPQALLEAEAQTRAPVGPIRSDEPSRIMIEKLGGYRVVARALKLPPMRVHNWTRVGIACRYWFEVAALPGAEEAGVTIDAMKKQYDARRKKAQEEAARDSSAFSP